MNILVPNLGSTSLKYPVLEMPSAAVRASGQVAAFETEFPCTMPDYAREYGVAAAWREGGVARYGFHGASHQYVNERATAMLGRPLRLVSCHLGGSSSMCAVDRSRAVDTTMGLSPQSGLENSTRHGDLDPFAGLFLMK